MILRPVWKNEETICENTEEMLAEIELCVAGYVMGRNTILSNDRPTAPSIVKKGNMCLAKLDEPGLPDRSKWFDELKQELISEEDYAFCVNRFKEKGFVTLRDWLIDYNNADTVGFIEALTKQRDFYYNHNVSMFFGVISLPG